MSLRVTCIEGAGPSRQGPAQVAGRTPSVFELVAAVSFGKRAHTPPLLAAGIAETDVTASWWKGRRLRVSFG